MFLLGNAMFSQPHHHPRWSGVCLFLDLLVNTRPLSAAMLRPCISLGSQSGFAERGTLRAGAAALEETATRVKRETKHPKANEALIMTLAKGIKVFEERHLISEVGTVQSSCSKQKSWSKS